MSTVWNSPQAAEVPRVAEDAHSLQERKGWCTIYTAVMVKPTRAMASANRKKKWCRFHAKQEIRTKNRFCCIATLSGERI